MDSFQNMNRETVTLVLILAFVLILVIIIGAICLLVSARNYRLRELEVALKQDLVNRGMTADDIERVIKATGQAEGPTFPPNLDPTTAAKLEMLAHGHDADDIERLLPTKSEAKK